MNVSNREQMHLSSVITPRLNVLIKTPKTKVGFCFFYGTVCIKHLLIENLKKKNIIKTYRFRQAYYRYFYSHNFYVGAYKDMNIYLKKIIPCVKR